MELGRYNVDGWLDRGPAHQLFRAVDGRLVYRLLPTAAQRTREVFRPTVELLVEALRDPQGATPPVSEVALDDDGDYLLVVEDVPGTPTQSFGAPVAPVMALALASRVLTGLAPLHARGLYHGALTPNRVLMDATARPVLFDAGAALMSDADPERRLNPSVPGFADLYTTPAFVPPEIFTWQPLTPATDVFLVSALAYRWLTGRSAHGTGRTMEIYARLRDGRWDPFPTLQANLNLAALRVLEGGLSPTPDDRPSAEELLAALRPFAALDITRLLTLASPPAPYSVAFAAMDPEDAPGPPGSPAERRRQDAVKQAALQLELMKSRRPEPRKRSRSGLWGLLVVVAVASVAIPVLMDRFKRDTARVAPPLTPAAEVSAPLDPAPAELEPLTPPAADVPAPPAPLQTAAADPPAPAFVIRQRQPEPEAVHSRRALEPVP